MPARALAPRVPTLLALLASLLAGCGSRDDAAAPRNVTQQQANQDEERKELNRARRIVKARKENVRGGVELAGFAQELQRVVLAGDRAELEALFVDPTLLSKCAFTRDKGSEVIEFSKVDEFLGQRRARLDLFGPLAGAKVVALVHKVRPRKRLMGARVDGEGCPLESRGRVNVVIQPAAPPPDAIENQFEAVFVAEKWWLISYERDERNCSELGTPEVYGCRALRGQE